MDKVSTDDEHAAKDVTIVIRRKIKPGCEKQYDDWLRRFLMLEKNIPGYVGTTIITQGGTASAIRHIVLRFSDTASLDAWEKSDEYLKQRAEADKYSTLYYGQSVARCEVLLF